MDKATNIAENLQEYALIKESAQKQYNSYNSIFSPAMTQRVYFSADGFNHIIYKGSRLERDKSSQMLRFKLLHLAIKLIGLSTTYQEFEETWKEIVIKKFKKPAKEIKVIRYWGIIAIIENRKIKIILRQIGKNGNLHFWSIIPAWTTNVYRDLILYKTMKGCPEED